MSAQRQPITILVADDDPDDRLLLQDAIHENRLNNVARFVENGEELMDYLHRRGKYTDPETSPCPGLILLDLNMPRKDGREVLGEIAAEPALRRIPVVVMTTSRSEDDIDRCYGLGANSYIPKPVTFGALVNVTKTLAHYWFDVAALPGNSHANG